MSLLERLCQVVYSQVLRSADVRGITSSFILFYFLLHTAVVEVPLTIDETVRYS